MKHIAEREYLVDQVLLLLCNLLFVQTFSSNIKEVRLVVCLFLIDTLVLESVFQFLAPVGA